MTIETRVLALSLAVACALWVLALVRGRRLYVGYAAIYLASILVGATAIAVPPMLESFARFVGIGNLVVIAIAIVFVFVIYLGSQLTLVADRVHAIAQEMAIQHAQRIHTEEDADNHDGVNSQP